MIKTNQKSILFPDFVAASVLELDPSTLKKVGITHLAFDADETVVPKNHNSLTDTYFNFLKKLEEDGFKLLIASNTKRDLSDITKYFQATLVPPSFFVFKPLKKYYKKVILAAKTDPRHIAMIGDKVLNDIIGANHAGLQTILVEPYTRRQKSYNRYYLSKALSSSTKV